MQKEFRRKTDEIRIRPKDFYIQNDPLSPMGLHHRTDARQNFIILIGWVKGRCFGIFRNENRLMSITNGPVSTGCEGLFPHLTPCSTSRLGALSCFYLWGAFRCRRTLVRSHRHLTREWRWSVCSKTSKRASCAQKVGLRCVLLKFSKPLRE